MEEDSGGRGFDDGPVHRSPAMPSKAQIEQALRTHVEAWNAQDRARWLANFAEDVHLEDPVGGPRKRGRAALEKTWENSFKDGHCWRLEVVLMQVCANQAALHVKNHGMVEHKPVELDSIEIYSIDDAGRIAEVRTYFNPPAGQSLDPYFMQQG